LGTAIKDEFIVAMDIRDIPDQAERRRILDFVTGMVFMSNATMRSINKDGVFLILPSNSSLSTEERERLQELGLYRLNV
jgi:FtsZ-interacting cell division protein YlmF